MFISRTIWKEKKNDFFPIFGELNKKMILINYNYSEHSEHASTRAIYWSSTTNRLENS